MTRWVAMGRRSSDPRTGAQGSLGVVYRLGDMSGYDTQDLATSALADYAGEAVTAEDGTVIRLWADTWVSETPCPECAASNQPRCSKCGRPAHVAR